jgi:hypothetical protein
MKGARRNSPEFDSNGPGVALYLNYENFDQPGTMAADGGSRVGLDPERLALAIGKTLLIELLSTPNSAEVAFDRGLLADCDVIALAKDFLCRIGVVEETG